MLDDRVFHDLVDEIFLDIEDRIDELDADIDIDSSGGVLTFTLADDSHIILSRQISNHEIWVAAKSGGFHLARDGEAWHCAATEESLEALIDRVFVEQSGQAVFLSD